MSVAVDGLTGCIEKDRNSKASQLVKILCPDSYRASFLLLFNECSEAEGWTAQRLYNEMNPAGIKK